jgi:hypothetical protein
MESRDRKTLVEGQHHAHRLKFHHSGPAASSNAATTRAGSSRCSSGGPVGEPGRR